jgi:hypothetical protein
MAAFHKFFHTRHLYEETLLEALLRLSVSQMPLRRSDEAGD